MANRFQSIVDGMTERALKDFADLYPNLTTGGHWYIAENGDLCVRIKGKEHVFTFERGDPDSEAFVALLNQLPFIVQAFGARASETRTRN